jgi:hypothetical protein
VVLRVVNPGTVSNGILGQRELVVEVGTVKLKFLGTRGEIDIRTRLHRMHSSLEVSVTNCKKKGSGKARQMHSSASVRNRLHASR